MDLIERGSQLIHKKTGVISIIEKHRRVVGGGTVEGKVYSESQLRETFDVYRINQFRKGSRIRIKTFQEFKKNHSNLVVGSQSNFRARVPRLFSEVMNKFCGKTYTIIHANPSINSYDLKGVGSYVFSREMFAENNEIYSEI